MLTHSLQGVAVIMFSYNFFLIVLFIYSSVTVWGAKEINELIILLCVFTKLSLN